MSLLILCNAQLMCASLEPASDQREKQQRSLPSWIPPKTWSLGLTRLCTVFSSSTQPTLCSSFGTQSRKPRGGPCVISMSMPSGIRFHLSSKDWPLGRLKPHPLNQGVLWGKIRWTASMQNKSLFSTVFLFLDYNKFCTTETIGKQPFQWESL